VQKCRVPVTVSQRGMGSYEELCITEVQFYSELIFLKPRLNRDSIPYSHWGGTDYGEVKSPCQRRGAGSSPSGINPRRPLALRFIHCRYILPAP
jgi:hypothetical protein